MHGQCVYSICHIFDTENPIQVLCDHYQFLMQSMEPNEIAQASFFKNLLTRDELNIMLSNNPMKYMKNSYILEFIRILEVPRLFSFIETLQGIDSQKHIGDTLLKGKISTPIHTA